MDRGCLAHRPGLRAPRVVGQLVYDGLRQFSRNAPSASVVGIGGRPARAYGILSRSVAARLADSFKGPRANGQPGITR